MRALGAALILVGGAATTWGARAAVERRRPVDLVGALVAPAGVLVALVGGVLLVEPGFLG
jgi:hypothetical protein